MDKTQGPAVLKHTIAAALKAMRGGGRGALLQTSEALEQSSGLVSLQSSRDEGDANIELTSGPWITEAQRSDGAVCVADLAEATCAGDSDVRKRTQTGNLASTLAKLACTKRGTKRTTTVSPDSKTQGLHSIALPQSEEQAKCTDSSRISRKADARQDSNLSEQGTCQSSDFSSTCVRTITQKISSPGGSSVMTVTEEVTTSLNSSGSSGVS